MARLFGTDGVRGVANESLTPELAFGLGRATGGYFSNTNDKRTKIIIGRDTRVSGEMLEAALAAGITSTGADVVLVGIIPTPGVAYLCRELEADAGVMISASHNPVEDNGIKIFDSDGFKLTDTVEDEIEEIYQNQLATLKRPVGVDVGRIIRNDEAIELYQKYLTASVTKSFRGLKIVVDCGYGAAYYLAPTVLKELGAEVIALHAENDGSKINVKCGSTNIERLQAEVIAQKADLGIAHDGDADRIITVDEAGQMIDGDQIMTICGLHLLKEGKLRNNKIAVTVYSNLGLIEAFKKHNAEVEITANGDRYVLEALKEHNLILGGEQSGHIIFLEKNTTGDGIMTALQLVSVVVATGKKLSELAAQMDRFPQVLENVRVANKNGWETNEAIQAVIKEVEQQLGDTGRLFVRASGTEPLIRVMAEGPDETTISKLVKQVVAIIKREQG